MTEIVKAWQCIGCGRIEKPETCVGVCQYEKIEMVYSGEHEEALAAVRERAAPFEALVRRLARITPRAGEFERSYRALQEEARALVARADAAP